MPISRFQSAGLSVTKPIAACATRTLASWKNGWIPSAGSPTRRVKTRDPSALRIRDWRSFSGIQLVADFSPRKWKTLPQQTVSESGRKWLVVEMPGTGKFSGMGTSGDTKMRLWIDERRRCPEKLGGSAVDLTPGAEWATYINFRFIWDTPEPPESLFEPKYPPNAIVRERRAEKEPNIDPAELRAALTAGDVLATRRKV